MKFSIALNSIQSSGKEVHIFPWNHFLFWLKSVLESINQRLWFCAEHIFGRSSAKTLKNICGLSVKLKGLRGNPLPLLWSFLLLVVSKYVLWHEVSGHWFGSYIKTSMFELNMFHHITFHVLSSSAGLSMAITQWIAFTLLYVQNWECLVKIVQHSIPFIIIQKMMQFVPAYNKPGECSDVMSGK